MHVVASSGFGVNYGDSFWIPLRVKKNCKIDKVRAYMSISHSNFMTICSPITWGMCYRSEYMGSTCFQSNHKSVTF